MSFSLFRADENLAAVPVTPQERADWLSNLPPWRQVSAPWDAREDRCHREVPPFQTEERRRASSYVLHDPEVAWRVNLALHLRRPLLVGGDPGLGKSSLGWSIALALGLGPPLRWEIGSRTTLEEGLFRYDAVGHLQDTRANGGRPVGDFFVLGPLGTALLPTRLPRLLIIDELDKSSYDLPNDLLHVLEEGSFLIPALARETGVQWVSPADRRRKEGEEDRVPIYGGRVQVAHHPVILITTNQEREFPPAFLRRCVRLEMKRPDSPEVLEKILGRWLGPSAIPKAVSLLEQYPEDATDVLLQALYLEQVGADRERLKTALSRVG